MENNWLNLLHLLKNVYDIENKLLLKEKQSYDKVVVERKNERILNYEIEYDKFIIVKVEIPHQYLLILLIIH